MSPILLFNLSLPKKKKKKLGKRIASGSIDPGPLVDVGKLTSRSKADDLKEICRQLLQDIEVKDRMVGLRLVKGTFIGVDAVDWITANTEKSRRHEAIAMLTEMCRAALITAVDSSLQGVSFHDSGCLYQELVGPATMDDFEQFGQIDGSFAEFHKGRRKGSQDSVALYVVTDKARKDACLSAVEMFRKIRHPNLCRIFHGFSRDSDKAFVVVMENLELPFSEAVVLCRAWSEKIVGNVVR